MSYYSKSTHKKRIDRCNITIISALLAVMLFFGTIAVHLYNHTIMNTENHAPAYTTEIESCVYDTITSMEYQYGVNPSNNKTEFHWVSVSKFIYGEHEVTYQHWIATLTLRNGEVENDYRTAEVRSTVCLYKG